jgi:hypothetical protein
MNPDPVPPQSADALKKEALEVGVRLAKFSQWPVKWHPLVMRALRVARRAGVEEVYITVKYGSLRIQGGSSVMSETAYQIEIESERTCVYCGSICDLPRAPYPPSCAGCRDPVGKVLSIEWVETTVFDVLTLRSDRRGNDYEPK